VVAVVVVAGDVVVIGVVVLVATVAVSTPLVDEESPPACAAPCETSTDNISPATSNPSAAAARRHIVAPLLPPAAEPHAWNPTPAEALRRRTATSCDRTHALVGDPAIVLVDEPTGNLDSRTGAELVALLQQLNTQGATIVVITRNDDVAAATGRRIGMRDGRIIDTD
jgi:hypothetical protein